MFRPEHLMFCFSGTTTSGQMLHQWWHVLSVWLGGYLINAPFYFILVHKSLKKMNIELFPLSDFLQWKWKLEHMSLVYFLKILETKIDICIWPSL